MLYLLSYRPCRLEWVTIDQCTRHSAAHPIGCGGLCYNRPNPRALGLRAWDRVHVTEGEYEEMAGLCGFAAGHRDPADRTDAAPSSFTYAPAKALCARQVAQVEFLVFQNHVSELPTPRPR